MRDAAERPDDLPVEEVRSSYLHPGHMFVSSLPARVITILGSCVAVCLWDPATRIGGINHYLLPTNPKRGTLDLRYGNTAIPRLIDEMVLQGASKSRLSAKLFGGACVMEMFSSSPASIGDQNILIAREILRQSGIEVAVDQTGGKRGRKLIFHTDNGCVSMKEI